MRKFLKAAAFAAALGTGGTAMAQEDISITLVPGLTTDAFYITMNRGAQAAAKALGITVDFQGAEEFDPVLQTPVLDAVIARGPDASDRHLTPTQRADSAHRRLRWSWDRIMTPSISSKRNCSAKRDVCLCLPRQGNW